MAPPPPPGRAHRAVGRPARVWGLALLLLMGLLVGSVVPAGASAAQSPGSFAKGGLLVAASPELSCTGKLQALAATSSSSGGAPLSTNFNGSACGGTAPYTYLWTFGDGQTSTQRNVMDVTFATSGDYSVVFEVTDARSAHAWSNLTESVSPTFATATTAPSGTAPWTVTFWGNVSGTSGKGVVVWQFGDGAEGSVACGSPIAHTYASPGNYSATATATVNGTSWAGHGSVQVQVEGSHPAPAPLSLQLIPSPDLGTAPLAVDFSAQASGGTGPYSLSACFGDGSPCAILLTGWSGTTSALPHTYETAGIYTLSATVTDASGAQDASSSTVVVEGVSSVLAEGSLLSHNGTAPFQATFVASAEGGTPPYTIEWSFGDGASGSGVLGVPTTHTYTSPGTYDPVLTVTDVDGHSSSDHLSAVVVKPGAGAAPSSPGFPSFGLPGGPLVTDLSVLGLIGVLVVVVLLEERRRSRELNEQARELVEAMESAKGLP